MNAPRDVAAMPWTVAITNLETRLRVGIWAHELEYQPVRVTLSLALPPGAAPQRGADCLDSRPLRQWITEEWPRQAHTPLLETRLRELMAHVFQSDARIAWIDAALSKPQACREAAAVGVRMALSREEHARAFGPGAGAAQPQYWQYDTSPARSISASRPASSASRANERN
ncbi:MAG: dihydroneopterin aldolase [Pseudomonadota bacterium]